MKVSIIGAGAFGLTLANILIDNHHEVLVYVRNIEKCNYINEKHLSPVNNYQIYEEVKCSNKLDEVINFSDVIVLAIPSSSMRSSLTEINNLLANKKLFINVAKGIEEDSLYTMSQIFNEVVNKEFVKGYVTLSGPSLAKDIMDKKITLLLSASHDVSDAEFVQHLFSNTKYLRIYSSHDVVGVEVCGSVKNAIALISGILSGLDLGENARAALICRGLEEIKRIITTYGGDIKTLYGLSGIGDLIVTSVSNKSRNFQAGLEFAKGKRIDEVLKDAKEVIEGIKTINSCYQIASKYQLDLPILNTAYNVIYKGGNPLENIDNLMKRELKSE